MANESTTCPSCGITIKPELGYVRCPECSAALQNGNQGQSLAWTMAGVLKRHEGELIGINYDKPDQYVPAQLVRVNEDYFSVRIERLYMHFPFSQILNIAESKGWIRPSLDRTDEYNLVVCVHQLHPQKSSVRIGVLTPI
jgi:hypothetical protein